MKSCAARLVGCLWLLMPAALMAQASPQVRVMEESSIPYARFLAKADFDLRFPGTLLSDTSKLQPGWYVVYQHEMLNYYFGPMLLKSTGSDYLAQLETIVAAAVAQRPSIKDYRLELSYFPQAEVAQSPPEASEPAAEPDRAPPAAKKSIWGFIKRIFGFGG